MILAHCEGEMRWLWAVGVAVDDYALEVVILAHCEGEMRWLWVVGVAVDNYALEVVILAHCVTHQTTTTVEQTLN